MNTNLLNQELDRINIENIIWLIYFFLIGFNLYSNYLETKYIKENDVEAKNQFRSINKTVLTISLIIYLYFLYLNWQDITNLNNQSSRSKIKLTAYSFIASILFVIAGILTLYVACNINVLDDEALGII